jgi:hypothetical protein
MGEVYKKEQTGGPWRTSLAMYRAYSCEER